MNSCVKVNERTRTHTRTQTHILTQALENDNIL
jgi:hypothetical protein